MCGLLLQAWEHVFVELTYITTNVQSSFQETKNFPTEHSASSKA